MTLHFTLEAWEEYQYWQSTDRKRLNRLHRLIRETLRTPYAGIGKPEPLKWNLDGYWSRRIDAEHRLIYKVEDDALWIVQCRHHY